MSTTESKHAATTYSGVTKQRGTIFEIQAGKIDLGASIQFLSQYPGEEEYLWPPLSCLEVLHQRSDSIMLSPLRFSREG
jgi:hypothetical protein